MTTSTVGQIATALASKLSGGGIRTMDYLSDTFSAPCALVGIERVEYHGTFQNKQATHTYTVFVICSRSSERSGISAMEGYMSNTGATSIRVLLETDQTLGGVAETAKVVEAGPPAAIQINGAEYISCPFTCEVTSG